jgi:hypothetical protein
VDAEGCSYQSAGKLSSNYSIIMIDCLLISRQMSTRQFPICKYDACQLDTLMARREEDLVSP